MKISKLIWRQIPVSARYRYKVVLLIALSWTLIDQLYLFVRLRLPGISPDRDLFDYHNFNSILLRTIVVFLFSASIAFVLFFQAHRNTIELPLSINFLIKIGLLILLAFLMNFLIFFIYSILFLGRGPCRALSNFAYYAYHTTWMIKKLPGWILTFSLLQVIVEVIKKYSPGIF